MTELTFKAEERVLCYHGPLMYEAKVLVAEHWQNRQDQNNGPHYFIHYKGWKQSWDEWVPETRVHKYNEDNLRKSEALKASYFKNRKSVSEESLPGLAAAENRSSASPVGGNPMSSERGRKRLKADGTLKADGVEDANSVPEMKLQIPHSLKLQLVDDWEYVTRQQRLVPLPRQPSISDILQHYKEECLKANSDDPNIVEEIVAGILHYFNRTLGVFLLYRFERQQFADTQKSLANKDFASVYGAEHFLRLCVKLPMMVSETDMDEESVSLLRRHINDLLRFVAKHLDRFVVKEYENAAPDYISLSKAF